MTKDDTVPVTAEDRELAIALFEAGLLKSPLGASASDDMVLARWRSEYLGDGDRALQIIARHRGSTAGVDVEALDGPNEVHTRCTEALLRHRGCDIPKDADWSSVQFGEIAAADVRAILASLSQTPATPMVQEGLREALAEAYRKGATDVHNYWVNNPGEPPQGDPEFGEAASDYASAALDIFDSSARALSATPAHRARLKRDREQKAAKRKGVSRG